MDDSKQPEQEPKPPSAPFESAGRRAGWREPPSGAFSGKRLIAVIAGFTLLVVIVLVIAGGSDSVDERVSEVSIVDTDEIPEQLVDDEALEEYPADSAERAFLTWWRALQFRAWPEAISLLDPGFRSAAGGTAILDGFQPNIAYYPTVRPEIVGADQREGGVSVRYAVGASDGKAVLSNNAFMVDTPQGWRVAFDSALVSSIRAGVEERIRVEDDPSAQAPSSRAVQAGRKVATAINAYLAQRGGTP